MAPDPVTVEVIRNAFNSIAAQMNNNLARSAYTPIIYEMKDCSVGIFDSSGRLLGQAPGLPIFLGNLEAAIHVTTDHLGGEHAYRPGDVFAVNDSYLTGSHLNDVSVFSPVFDDGDLVGFGATKAHWLDIGAKDPSQSMDSTEIYEEGYRIGPTRLYAAGEPVADTIEFLTRNSRLSRSIWGDMHAQIAACRTGEQQLQDLYDRFGGEVAHPGGWPLWLSGVLVPVAGEAAMAISKMHAEIFDLERCPIEHVFTYVDGDDPSAAVRGAFETAGLLREEVGVEDSLWLADADLLGSSVPSVRLRRTGGVFDRLRSVKDAYEIEQLRTAAAAHDAGYRRAAEVIRPGVTVAAAGSEIVRAMVEAGSEDLSIVGTFKTLTNRRFETGDIVDVDLFPGSHGGYRADSARNVFIGDPSSDARHLYEATLHAYQAAVAATQPGVTAESVHQACAGAMAEAGYNQVWKVGHGVGLGEAHEAPLLQPGNTDPIEPGMVFTIDPGAFVSRDTPIHIEDTVVVTEAGCTSLNSFPREMLVV